MKTEMKSAIMPEELGVEVAGFGQPLMMGGRNWQGLGKLLIVLTLTGTALVCALKWLRPHSGNAVSSLFNPYG